MKNDFKQPKKTVITVLVIALAVILVMNLFVFPAFYRNMVEEATYTDFLTMLEAGEIREVEITDTTLTWVTGEKSKERFYTTGLPEDGALVERLAGAGVTFAKVLPQKENGFLLFLMEWVVPLGLCLLVGNLMMRKLTKMGGGPGAMSFGKSNAKVYVAAQTGKSFDDVAGEDEAKQALREIVDFLHCPEKYKEIGARLPKGALLVGPPGTGKTLLAQAVAGEANVPFFSISGSEFVEMFVGMGAARVRDLFKQAQEKAPCIVFIDEIDAIGKKRDGSGMSGNDEREQTLNQLLTEMDGFDGSKGVVILAASNRPESLDPALLRPGRFDRRIPVELPDLLGREQILNVHARHVKMDPQVDLHAIALATSGASGADLANMINEGALLAVKLGRKQVKQSDLEEAVETVLAGYQRKNAVISSKEKCMVSYHEVGHALVAALQTESAPVHKITIIPRTSGALGYTMQVDEQEHYLMTRQELVNKITTLTAGRAAEELVFHTVTSGAAGDIEQATKLARQMVSRLGMSEKLGMMALENTGNVYLGGDSSLVCSPETSSLIDGEVREIISQAHTRALALLSDNMDALHSIAKCLLEKETITGMEFMELLKESRPKLTETAE